MTDVSKELLPCPFCGSPAALIDAGNAMRPATVGCPKKENHIAFAAARTVEAAIAAWNTRAQPAPADVVELVEELRFAEKELLSVSTPKHDEVESLTGLSFRAIADYTRRAADALSAMGVSDEVVRLREALQGLVQAVEKDAHENNSISGYTGARLSDARQALAHKEGNDLCS